MSRWTLKVRRTPIGTVGRLFFDDVELPGVYSVSQDIGVDQIGKLSVEFLTEEPINVVEE